MKTILKSITMIMMLLCIILALSTVGALGVAAVQPTSNIVDSSVIDYDYDATPVEEIKLSIVGNIQEIQPRQSFTISYLLNPWYTTTKQVQIDIFPQNAGKVSNLDLLNKTATIEVASGAEVGGTISAIVSADNVKSNIVEIAIVKIPVENIMLAVNGMATLHQGRTSSVTSTISPSFATNSAVRYEVDGSGMKYIQSFNKETGEIKAYDSFETFEVGATVTITAISLDNQNLTSSVTLTIVIPTTLVELSALTPRNGLTANNNPLAVASSQYGDTVTLKALINGVASVGLSYVIVSGQEYIKNGQVNTDDTFEIKKTTEWTETMKISHAEIRIKVAYSDGFDEIIISIYVPVESYSFNKVVPSEVENFREYDFAATAFPHYATHLADNAGCPLKYTLEGVSSDIAVVNNYGTVKLSKSLTSKNSFLNLAVYANGWQGVDAIPLEHRIKIVPVYATGFEEVKILQNGKEIDPYKNKAICGSQLEVEVIFTIDNVTDIRISMFENSEIISVENNTITIASLEKMTEDNPIVDIKISYDEGGKSFNVNKKIAIYVLAKSAEISENELERGTKLDLKSAIVFNGHGYATNKNIIWGVPRVTTVNKQECGDVKLEDGVLEVFSQAHAGTIVVIPYKTVDGEEQEKVFMVNELDSKKFKVFYGKDTDLGSDYSIDVKNPQLEEGHSVQLYIKYGDETNGLDASKVYGVSYDVKINSGNATLSVFEQSGLGYMFKITSNAGMSGKNNFIKYGVTVTDGNMKYELSTDVSEFAKPIAIFHRISTTTSIYNKTIAPYEIFKLTGWDDLATVDETSLVWTVNDKILPDCKMIGLNSGFKLKVSAKQQYNGVDISWHLEIGYSSIIYNDGDKIVNRIYKMNDNSIKIAGSDCCNKTDFKLTGWCTTKSADLKSYEFNFDYNENKDLELWACWTTKKGEKDIGDIFYEGTVNSCKYDLIIGSDSVDNNNYNKGGFFIKVHGLSCVRKWGVTFKISIDFVLKKDGKEIDTSPLEFTIKDKDDVPGNDREIFNSKVLNSVGNYTLEWSGTIESTDTSYPTGSYDFAVNFN